jgi:hypothetical protein
MLEAYVGPISTGLSPAGGSANRRTIDNIIDGDRFPLSPRIMTLKAIRAKLRPEPAREPLPPLQKATSIGARQSAPNIIADRAEDRLMEYSEFGVRGRGRVVPCRD